MTIGKKLYVGFGAVLAVMLVLFLINVITVAREYSARGTVTSLLGDVQAIESVRYQLMENRLFLGSYLLSGDLRDEDKTNKGINDLQDALKLSEAKATDADLRTALSQVEQNERDWAENFAKPMIAKRHQVDAGDATVSDLQIYYLQHDPSSWVNKSAGVLDDASRNVHKSFDEANESAKSATLFNAVITTSGTLFAIVLGGLIAFRTAKSIKDPLYHLIEVAHRIGETGDLDQTIDIHRADEVGTLADNFNKMITHLRGMASVSTAISEGQLSVTIQPRSQSDTMAKAFARMTEGLRTMVRQVRRAGRQRCGTNGERVGRIGEGQRPGRLRD